ncbi:MAG: MATE family efflux transporter [Oscillospiraceae bacterium]|nr:MATE family efflux transporter [Oscillospiraceae bacterium]
MKNRNDMLTGNAVKSIIFFALPIMLSSLLQYNYTLIDNIIVGRYVSTDALAAVGNVGSINSFIIGAALGLTSGFTIPVAHAFGAKDSKKVTLYASGSIIIAFLIGLFLVVFAHIISSPLLKLIGTPEEIINLSASYVNILYFGIPFQMLSNNFTAISRAVGESKKPLYLFMISCIVNFLLDILFVKHLGLGVEGAAAATLISHIVAASLTGFYIIKINKNVEIKHSDLRLKPKIALEQLKLGIPVSLQFTVTSIGSMCLQSAVNSFGANVMAGFTAAGRVENLTNIPMSGLGVATQTFVGQNYGAGNYNRIIKSVKRIFILDLFVSILMSITLYAIGMPMVSLFMSETNAEMLFAAKHYIITISSCYSLVAVLFVLRNTLQGFGFTYSNTVAGAGELLGRLAIAFVLTPALGFNAVCFAGPAAWLLADIPLAVIYLHKQKKFKAMSAVTTATQTETAQ